MQAERDHGLQASFTCGQASWHLTPVWHQGWCGMASSGNRKALLLVLISIISGLIVERENLLDTVD